MHKEDATGPVTLDIGDVVNNGDEQEVVITPRDHSDQPKSPARKLNRHERRKLKAMLRKSLKKQKKRKK